ncbi:2-dehydropantoate 2-reductase [Burkholderia sp. Leaf177]|uniref:ketopantoate reductase family protein n=1 Tax=Burkholderia sp. Leaf177 TaxID=1736287 RepID=UPI0006F61297|nr:ketopantoate reductase family protein [Burkholderia sp. Leaf177]KQR78585.1 2-dehydropantoate 2-reductase [Burkholderia sp. Leaf177]
MKAAVMGAGAVGCYYGGMLARAGHEVTLIGRPNHVDAIERDGLRMQTLTFDEHVRVAASTQPGAVEGASLVLFCVKSTDTESAAAELKLHLAADALVLVLQNGVDNADRVRKVVSQEVAAAVVYVAAGMEGPGHVRHHGRGDLVIEPSSQSEAVARVLIDSQIPTEISFNVRGALWAKLILNCAYNALSAITQLPYGRLAESANVEACMHDIVGECLAVAKAENIEIPGDVDASVRMIAEKMPTQYSSTAQDVARSKPTEIDHLNGLIVRLGEKHGIATPANRVLHALVKAIEMKYASAV